MAAIGDDGFTSSRIPDVRRAIPRRGGEARAIVRPRYTVHPSTMLLVGEEWKAAAGFPELYRLIPGGRGEPCTIR